MVVLPDAQGAGTEMHCRFAAGKGWFVMTMKIMFHDVHDDDHDHDDGDGDDEDGDDDDDDDDQEEAADDDAGDDDDDAA